MHDEALTAITYIAIIYGLWLLVFAGATIKRILNPRFKTAWRWFLGLTIVSALIVLGAEMGLIQLL